MNLIMRTALVSDTGLLRDNNEDAAYAGRRLIVVADGMGGPPAGEVASDIVVRALTALDAALPATGVGRALRDAVIGANHEIAEAAQADPANAGMGTTATAMALAGDELSVVHVGDSRGYLLRDGELSQVTRDDTFVQELVDRGALTAEQAWHHPRRSLVTNAVQGLDLTLSSAVLTGRAGDRLLLCSDGLSDVVPADAIRSTLVLYAEPQECAEQLVKLAHRAGAPDNVTVVVADLFRAERSGQGALGVTTTMPSASLKRMSPGENVTVPKVTGTSTSPAPVLPLLRGLVPSTLIPSGNSPRTTTSRTAPCSTRPAHPLRAPSPAMTSPTNAVRSDAPPSTTRTCPAPRSPSTPLTSALSS
jgi:serine/threonine protein phosphatase PrpC